MSSFERRTIQHSDGAKELDRARSTGRRSRGARCIRVVPVRAVLILLLWLTYSACFAAGCFAQSPASTPQAQTQTAANRSQASKRYAKQPLGPCQLRRAGAAVGSAASIRALEAAGFTPSSAQAVKQAPCPAYLPVIDWYARFLTGPQVKPLTPKEKAWLAIRNVADPFNILTIAGDSAIAVASTPHSAYGPGFPGFGRNVGVSFSQDVTSEFFGTFLIPSITREDPHYHRMPNASIPRRFLHTITQIVWTQGDNGRGMINYSDLVGFAIDNEIGNLYVPGVQTDVPASATRYAIGLGLAPVDNLITEFVPDVARRIHVRVVFVQRIINQVAKSSSSQ